MLFRSKIALAWAKGIGGTRAGVADAFIPDGGELTGNYNVSGALVGLAADHPTWCPGCGDFSVLALYFKLIEKRKFWQEIWQECSKDKARFGTAEKR